MPWTDERRELEAKLARELAAQLGITEREALELLGSNLNLDNLDESFWQRHRDALALLLVPALIDIFIAGNENMGRDRISIDPLSVRQAASTWAELYTGNLVSDIERTTQRVLQRYVATAIEEGLTIDELAAQIAATGPFTPLRAELIATTETTRALSAGEDMYIDEYVAATGASVRAMWETHPELTETGPCQICAPLNGRFQGDGWWEPPPAHPRCVCTRVFIEE